MSKYTGTVLTDVVRILSGPYAGKTGTIDRWNQVELDPGSRFTIDESSAWFGDTLHTGLTPGPREISWVNVRPGEYQRLTESEVLKL